MSPTEATEVHEGHDGRSWDRHLPSEIQACLCVAIDQSSSQQWGDPAEPREMARCHCALALTWRHNRHPWTLRPNRRAEKNAARRWQAGRAASIC